MIRKSGLGMWIVVGLVMLWVVIWLFPIWNVLASGSKNNQQYLSSNPWDLPPLRLVIPQFLKNAQIGLVGDVSVTNQAGSHAGNILLPAVINSLLYSISSAILAIILY